MIYESDYVIFSIGRFYLIEKYYNRYKTYTHQNSIIQKIIILRLIYYSIIPNDLLKYHKF